MRTAEKRVTNVEFVNGVHPLHWATSPGSSPMGTDPIKSQNGTKMFLEALNINFGNRIECYAKPSRLHSSGNYNSAFKRQRKLNHDRV
jgi:hypothetical protein